MPAKTNYQIEWYHGKHENVLISGKQKLKLPPLQILKWLFRYDMESGKLYKIRESSGKVIEQGREITTVSGNGYLVIGITDSNSLMKLFQVHQLIYYIVSGIEPLQIVDHISGNKLDNRFSNLRLVSNSLNARNAKMRSHNTSGITGVHWHSRDNKWVAYAYDTSGRQKHLGSYLDKEEAIEVITAWYSNPINNFSDRHGLPVGS